VTRLRSAPRALRCLGLVAIFATPVAAWAQESLLERDVLPILAKQCLGCHGGLRQKGGLDLRTIPLMLKGGKSGPAVKSGDAAASEMWKRVAADEMPPGDKKLSPAEKNHLQQWIAARLPTVAERQKDDDPLLGRGDKHAPKEVAAADRSPSPRRARAAETRLRPRER
jgi:mono/diheme cytochrome c family protein